MEKTRLGNIDAEFAILCLGTMYFGSRTDEDTSRKLLDRYVEAGGDFLDTANAYSRWVEGCQGGESEALLGRWLEDRNNRNGLFIASKVGFPAPVDDQEFGLSAAQIEHACEASLKRMGIETIDLCYARNRYITIVAYFPLAGGAYTQDDKQFPEEYLGPDTDTRLKVLREVAGDVNATPNQVVLAWMMRTRPVVVPITAASSLEQLDENLGSLDVELSDEQKTRLSQAGNARQQNPFGQRVLVPGMKEG